MPVSAGGLLTEVNSVDTGTTVQTSAWLLAAPWLSVACTVTLKLPKVVGRPLTSPDAGWIDRPGGRPVAVKATASPSVSLAVKASDKVRPSTWVGGVTGANTGAWLPEAPNTCTSARDNAFQVSSCTRTKRPVRRTGKVV